MNINEITKVCKVLGDANRMSIINMLLETELNATEILNRLQITQPTLSHHMKLLTECNVVLSRRDGNATFYSINKKTMNEMSSFLTAFGDGSNSESISNSEINYQNKLLSMAEDARKENEAKTEFLFRMSHDLRVPLSSIKGMLLVTRKNLENPEKRENLEQLEGNINKMENAIEQLEGLLDEILDMNEIESSIERHSVQPFNVFENARELNTVYAQKCEKAGLSYKCEIKGDIIHPYIISSRLYMRRVFQILMDNAIRYNNKNGSITVSFEEISFTETITTHRVIISDTGRGMTSEMVNLISGISGADNVNHHNIGLGLFIVKRLVEKIGGKMEVHSELQEGTSITLELPFEIDKKSEELFANASETSISGKRILLVEDNDLNLEVAQFILNDAGAQVVPAHNGKEAVDIVQKSAEGEFNLILMDLMMPVMNGFAATDIIRNMNRSDTKRIPIIAMSAKAFDEDIKKCLEVGMNEHISKPLNVNKLIAVLNKWI